MSLTEVDKGVWEERVEVKTVIDDESGVEVETLEIRLLEEEIDVELTSSEAERLLVAEELDWTEELWELVLWLSKDQVVVLVLSARDEDELIVDWSELEDDGSELRENCEVVVVLGVCGIDVELLCEEERLLDVDEELLNWRKLLVSNEEPESDGELLDHDEELLIGDSRSVVVVADGEEVVLS